ncbi:MAG: T9SS type A sorting domain-containing protein [Flammeovirgaceae bacterium]
MLALRQVHQPQRVILPVTLTWTDNSTNETGFQILRSLSETSGFAAIGTVSANVLTFTDNTVVANTTYFYRVVAFNNFGVSAFSAVSIATKQNQTITFAPVDKTVGDPAFALSATATSGLTVTSFTTTSDKIAISGSQVTLVKASRASVTANQAGNNTFLPAPPVERSFCIKPVKPTVTVTNVATGTPVLTSSATAGNQWFLNGTAISGATNPTLNVTAAGVYKVNVKVDDCTSDFSADATQIVTGDLPTNPSSLSVYPNPVNDYLQIEGISDIQESRLIDVAGKERKISLERNANGYHADVRDLPSGMYVLCLTGDAGVYQLKFVKK